MHATTNYEHQPPSDRAKQRETALAARLAATPRIGDGPHIWVGTTEDYLAAQPYGHWIEAAQPFERVQTDIAAMGAASPAGRANKTADVPWHVFAHHGFGRHRPPNGAPLRELVHRAAQYQEDCRAYRAWAWLGGDDPDWLHRFADAYLGRYERLEDWVVLEVERAGYDELLDRVVPDTIRPHVEIDIASLAHELRTSQAVLTLTDNEAGGVFVFRTSQAPGEAVL